MASIKLKIKPFNYRIYLELVDYGITKVMLGQTNIIDEFDDSGMYNCLNDKVKEFEVFFDGTTFESSATTKYSFCSVNADGAGIWEIDLNDTKVVGDKAFDGSSNCYKLRLGDVEEIGIQAFRDLGADATELTIIAPSATPPTVDYTAFYGSNQAPVLYCPYDTAEDYKNAVSSEYFNNVTIDDTEFSIEAYYNTGNITTLRFSNYYAFRGVLCKGEEIEWDGDTVEVKDMAIPYLVMHFNSDVIDAEFFKGIGGMYQVWVGKGITSIGYSAFEDCGLEDATIGKNVKRIGTQAFYSCSRLTDLTIRGNSLEYIGVQALCETDLSSITIETVNEPELAEDTFCNIPYGGTLTYPSGSDYSTWLSDDKYYLGYFEWNGVEAGTTTNPSIELEYTSKTLPYEGSMFEITATYTDIETVNQPSVGASWLSIDTLSTTGNEVKYKIEAQTNTSTSSRNGSIQFSGVDAEGNTITAVLSLSQEGKVIITTVAPTTTLLEFPYSGGTKTVQVNYTNPNGILEPVPSQSWISVQFKQSGSTTSGTDAVLQYQYAVTMAETENARQAPITFRCYDINGNIIENSHLICSQEGEPVIESDGVVSAFKTIFRVNADGSPEYSSDNYIRCGYSGVTISEPTVSADWINLGAGKEETGTFYGYSTVMYHTLSFDVNEGGERTGTITFKGTDSNGIQLISVVNITQYKAEVVEPEPEIPEDSTDETFSPIWKDIYYDFMGDTKYEIYKETYEYLNGMVYKNDELIYSGKIYLPPKEQKVRVHINKICQNYFDDSYLPTDGAVGKSHNYETFKLKNEYGTLLHTYHFVNDWSYEPLTLGIKTNPIIPNIVDGQMFFFSVYATEQKTVKWGMRYYNGDADYDNTEYVKNDFYTNIVAPSRQKGVKLFYVGNNQYHMIPKCKCQYVLYYLNPYGGFDWFPVLGRVTKKDKVTQYTYTNNYNNNTTEFGKYRYLSEISTEYNLNTGFLTESQSDRMWELMESNCVYLHNVVEDKIYPVLITDTDIEYKKKIRGRKMLSYSINVELSQTRERI